MTKPQHLLTVGSWAVFDHLFTVEKLPGEGETVNILTPVEEVDQIYWGGCSYNAAVAARQLGIEASVMAVEGEDFITRGYQSYLENRQINLSGVTIAPGQRSGHGFLFADPHGNGVVIGNLGAAWIQKDFQPDTTLIKTAGAVVVAPTFDQFTLSAARIARENQILTAVNGSLSTWPGIASEFVEVADILFGNNFEFERLAQLLGLDDYTELFGLGPQLLYVTLGAKGAKLVDTTGETWIPSVSAKEFVDPVGAGDAFVGATMAGILLGWSYEIAGRVGATVSSFVVEAKGSQTNMPDRKKIETRYETYFGESLPKANQNEKVVNL